MARKFARTPWGSPPTSRGRRGAGAARSRRGRPPLRSRWPGRAWQRRRAPTAAHAHLPPEQEVVVVRGVMSPRGVVSPGAVVVPGGVVRAGGVTVPGGVVLGGVVL